MNAPGGGVEAAVEAALAALTPAEKARLTAGATMFGTAPIEAIELAAINMADGPMGVASTRVDERDVAVLTPCGPALAASWDTGLVARVGAMVADEARRRGVQVMLAPNLGLPRSPLAGRAFETFSEDPFLTGEMGAAWITGLQSRGVGACAKHFVCNDSETQRDTMNAVVDERALREVYAAPFERAIAAGAWGVLTAYNRVGGTHCVEHPALIEMLKRDWGFDGFVVSDWFGAFDAVRSARAGLDLDMPGPARVLGEGFLEAVEAGEVDAARLDDAARRILRLGARTRRLGARTPEPAPDFTAADAALLREAAAAGFVLLRNEGRVLPLSPSWGRRLAVIGPNAAYPCHQGGTFAKIGLRPDALTPLQAIREQLGAAFEITYALGVAPEFRLPPMVAATADGVRGMTVEYFAGHDLSGEPLAREVRNTNSLTWFAALPGTGALDKPVAVRASGVLTPDVSGRHRIFVGGTGATRLKVDGTEVFRQDAEIEPRDIMGRLKSGVADAIEVELAAGRPVEISVELLAAPARAHGLWWGCQPPADPAKALAEAVEAARAADHVVLMVGETADSGVESIDRKDTGLSAAQVELIRKVCTTNRNTVVVVNAAHAVDLSCAWDAAAVLVVWYPGEAFGPALADVLVGALEPGGRLPVSFARREADYPAFDLTPDAAGDLAFSEGVLVGYRGLAASGAAPLFAFGEGLGYGRVEYDDLSLAHEGDAVVVRALAANRSDRPTKSVFQVYVTPPQGRAPKLAGFATDGLAPREKREIAVVLPLRAFSHWSIEAKAWRPTPGAHAVAAGASSVAARPIGTFDPTA